MSFDRQLDEPVERQQAPLAGKFPTQASPQAPVPAPETTQAPPSPAPPAPQPPTLPAPLTPQQQQRAGERTPGTEQVQTGLEQNLERQLQTGGQRLARSGLDVTQIPSIAEGVAGSVAEGAAGAANKATANAQGPAEPTPEQRSNTAAVSAIQSGIAEYSGQQVPTAQVQQSLDLWQAIGKVLGEYAGGTVEAVTQGAQQYVPGAANVALAFGIADDAWQGYIAMSNYNRNANLDLLLPAGHGGGPNEQDRKNYETQVAAVEEANGQSADFWTKATIARRIWQDSPSTSAAEKLIIGFANPVYFVGPLDLVKGMRTVSEALQVGRAGVEVAAGTARMIQVAQAAESAMQAGDLVAARLLSQQLGDMAFVRRVPGVNAMIVRDLADNQAGAVLFNRTGERPTKVTFGEFWHGAKTIAVDWQTISRQPAPIRTLVSTVVHEFVHAMEQQWRFKGNVAAYESWQYSEKLATNAGALVDRLLGIGGQNDTEEAVRIANAGLTEMGRIQEAALGATKGPSGAPAWVEYLLAKESAGLNDGERAMLAVWRNTVGTAADVGVGVSRRAVERGPEGGLGHIKAVSPEIDVRALTTEAKSAGYKGLNAEFWNDVKSGAIRNKPGISEETAQAMRAGYLHQAGFSSEEARRIAGMAGVDITGDVVKVGGVPLKPTRGPGPMPPENPTPVLGAEQQALGVARPETGPTTGAVGEANVKNVLGSEQQGMGLARPLVREQGGGVGEANVRNLLGSEQQTLPENLVRPLVKETGEIVGPGKIRPPATGQAPLGMPLGTTPLTAQYAEKMGFWQKLSTLNRTLITGGVLGPATLIKKGSGDLAQVMIHTPEGIVQGIRLGGVSGGVGAVQAQFYGFWNRALEDTATAFRTQSYAIGQESHAAQFGRLKAGEEGRVWQGAANLVDVVTVGRIWPRLISSLTSIFQRSWATREQYLRVLKETGSAKEALAAIEGRGPVTADMDIANKMTWTNPSMLASAIPSGIKGPLFPFFLFTNVVSNIAARGLEYIPVAGAAIGVARRSAKAVELGQSLARLMGVPEEDVAKFVSTDRDYQMLIYHQFFGTAGAAALGLHAANGGLNGNGPSDPTAKAKWLNAGNLPNHIKIGDYWIPTVYFGELAPLINTVANINDDWTYNIKAKDSDSFGRHAMGAFSGAVAGQFDTLHWLDALFALKDLATEKSGEKFAAHMASMYIPQIGATGTLQRTVEPGSVKVSSKLPWDEAVKEYLRSRFPGQDVDRYPTPEQPGWQALLDIAQEESAPAPSTAPQRPTATPRPTPSGLPSWMVP